MLQQHSRWYDHGVISGYQSLRRLLIPPPTIILSINQSVYLSLSLSFFPHLPGEGC